ncbi:MXAN_2561 family MXYO-CTERM-anchored protein [Archangium sp.]|uniref:MXAN_2561 family MXYO-CTERM-anchored protein n=1 Tax=Archangium sp. TaxID=1872627 RepID=UPI002D4489AB|nr:MXAN_2561 family MXYO-CTERM-anchored protein [Archangium sp.]HYO59441.1 MXAN_2561 family MXYO-CTERM-anchored protein [Archangium sp.]
MRTLLITATVLFSSAAFGQLSTGVQVQVQSVAGTDALSVGPELCGQTVTFNWKVAGNLCADLSLWITTDTDCKETASGQTAGSSFELSSISRTTIAQRNGSGTATFEVSRLPIFSASTPTDGGTGVTCSRDVEIEDTMQLCASTKQFSDIYQTSCSTVVKATTPMDITYDTKRPVAPTISSVASLDEALQVEVDPPDDALQVRVVVRLDGAEVTSETQGVDRGAVKVTELENGVTYQLEAYSIDQAGNVSSAFASGEGTPNRTLGFYEKYKEAGGAEMGGCGATGGGFAGGAVLAALGFWLFSRRNRS